MSGKRPLLSRQLEGCASFIHIFTNFSDQLIKDMSSNQTSNTTNIEEVILREESLSLQPIQRKDEDAVFLDENPQKILEKLQNLKTCNFKERLAYSRRLGELIQWIGQEAIDSLNVILQSIIDDSDDIKKSFIGQMGPICDFIKPRQDGYGLITQHIVPALSQLLRSQNFEIKELAGNQISKIASELNEVDRGNLILPEVIKMAHDETNDENIVIAIKLFGQLACIFGQELSESFIALEILSKGEDAKPAIRKEAVHQLANISKALSKEFVKNRILPFFQKKTEDRAWQTRKACVDIIVDLAENAEQECLDQIIQRMLSLLDDQNKWVKQAAFKRLGNFIPKLHGTQNLNEKLLEFYLKVNNNDIRDLSNEYDIQIECAFNFPAVLQTYGPKKWGQLNKLFQQFISHKEKKIKKPIACSLHEIAKILGPDIAYNELLKVLEQLLQDTNDEIKHGAVENLGKFFDAIEESKRASLIDILLIIQKDQKKWRIRQLIARQISHLAKVFDVETVFQIILPISTKLCNDNVFAVRKTAARQIYELYEKFEQSQNESYINILKQNILGFACSDMFSQRQSFVIMCQKLMLYERFQIDFLEQFVKLGHDPIKNVRILVAKVLQKQIFKQKGMYKDHTSIKTLWEMLLKDKIIYNSINQKKYSTNLHESSLKYESPLRQQSSIQPDSPTKANASNNQKSQIQEEPQIKMSVVDQEPQQLEQTEVIQQESNLAQKNIDQSEQLKQNQSLEQQEIGDSAQPGNSVNIITDANEKPSDEAFESQEAEQQPQKQEEPNEAVEIVAEKQENLPEIHDELQQQSNDELERTMSNNLQKMEIDSQTKDDQVFEIENQKNQIQQEEPLESKIETE